MKEIVLDGAFMTTREEMHDYLAEQLELPEYYGRNLDALWDVLTEMSEPMVVTLKNTEPMQETLGDYYDALVTLFEDIQEEPIGFCFVLEE